MRRKLRLRETDRHEETLRKLYDDFGRGDLDAMLAACAEDIEFHVPGSNQLSRTWGKSDFTQLITLVQELSGGSFREEVLDVMVGNLHGAVLLHHKLERDGETLGYMTLHLWEFSDGKPSQFWEYPRDLDSFNEIWK